MKTEGVRILQKQSVKVAELDSQDSSSLHNKVPSEAASVDAEAEASYPKDMVKKTDFNVGETALHQGTSRILWKNGIKR